MPIKPFDAIIIGGSYSGLSAAMSLGRALRNVLILDSGNPCNKQTPHSHNFITQDGNTPAGIAAIAKEQVLHYPTISFRHDLAINAEATADGFTVTTQDGGSFQSKKILLATGIRDIMPDIPGFANCWGISVIHCPYCHGYEVKKLKTALYANGDFAYHMGILLRNWTDDLTLVTNGPATLEEKQMAALKQKNVGLIEKPIDHLVHTNGQLKQIVFTDSTTLDLPAMYASVPNELHTPMATQLGCELNEQGLVKVDEMQCTTVPGVFAAGDCTSFKRSVSNAVATGTMAGAGIVHSLVFSEVH